MRVPRHLGLLMRRTTEHQKDKMIEAYFAGASLAEAGKLFGYSHATVTNALKDRGLKARPKGPSDNNIKVRQPSDAVKRQICELYANGRTLAEIVSVTGFCQKTCSNIVRQDGQPVRVGYTAIPRKEWDAVIEALHSGKTQVEVATAYGVSKVAVQTILEKKGLRKKAKPLATAEQKDKMVECYVAGMNAREAAATAGFGRETCIAELERRGIAIRKRTPSQEQVQKIIGLYSDGKSAGIIAQEFGRETTSILDCLRRSSVEIRSTGGMRKIGKDDESEVVRRYVQGESGVDLATFFGVDAKAIYRTLREKGVRRRIRPNLRTRMKSSARLRKKPISLNDWDGFTQPKWRRFMDTLEYTDFRQSVYVRDGYTCQDCNVRGGKLHAHHIWQKAKYPHLALLTSNGITLCKSCHDKLRQHEDEHAHRLLVLIASSTYPVLLMDYKK